MIKIVYHSRILMRVLAISSLIVAVFVFTGCKEHNDTLDPGKLTIEFSHVINNQPISYDAMIYTNTAGNEYEISEIQWFISDITLINTNNEEFLLDEESFAHYIDTDLPETWNWALPDEIQTGEYKAIKMTFGIKGEKNIPYYFPNSPESNMQWPYNLGGDQGGYHYMKLNGFWMNENDERTPFNFHMGVGQEYDNEGNVIGFIQNWFELEIPNSSFTLLPGTIQHINLIMNVEHWFQTPNTYDFNIYGGKIMKNQEAMGKIKENGQDVFSVKVLEVKNESKGL